MHVAIRALIPSLIVVVPLACSETTGTLPDENQDPGSDSSTGKTDTSSAAEDSSTPSEDGSATDAPSGDTGVAWVGPDGGIATKMNFFVTSKGPGKGGDMRANAGDADGLAGADAFCKSLANAVSPILGAKTWRAYLSTAAVTARSRIGNGPFYNAKGVLIANDVAQLHDEGSMNLLSLTTNLDELGGQVPISGPNQHDILTGSTAAGAAAANTCSNWTSNATGVSGQVGHSNRAGGGAAPTSWNAAHATQGCAESGANSVRSGGGRGSFYCFAL